MGQKEAIFDHLKRHGSITRDEAHERYDVYRLAARIGELREDLDPAFRIRTERCTGRHRKMIVKYVLERKDGSG